MNKFSHKGKNKIWRYIKNRKYMHISKERKVSLAVALIAVLLLSVALFIPIKINGTISGFAYSSNTASSVKIKVVTMENLPGYLEGTSLVKDLPKDAVISLKVGESSFIVKKGDVQQGVAENPDIEVWFDEKYLEDLGAMGICGSASKAKNENGFRVYSSLSELELLWKFRSLLKYKDCII